LNDLVGGARVFAMVIKEIRRQAPGCRTEVLIPDFQGNRNAIQIVVDARPDVLNHNTESVPRLYRAVRSGARYERTLELLRFAKELNPHGITKSGVMVGLGEETHELLAVFRDLAAVGCDILTIGQYLRPSRNHLPMARLYTPREFVELKAEALTMGFRHVESGPLVRSSYHAHEQAERLHKTQPTTIATM
jgi:lipoyl synthase